jgi:hypothetical protein
LEEGVGGGRFSKLGESVGMSGGCRCRLQMACRIVRSACVDVGGGSVKRPRGGRCSLAVT